MEHSESFAVDRSAAPVDYVEDEIASAFFDARECEAYYRSRPIRGRDFYDEFQLVLVRLLSLANGDALAFLDDLIRRVAREEQAVVRTASGESAAARVRRIEPEGFRLLGNDAALGLDRLRAAYRAAALRCHPDRGGTCQQMAAVNHAFEQLHQILVGEAGASPPSSGEFAGAATYLWTVRRLLFEMAVDNFALDDAVHYLEELVSAKGMPPESHDRRVIELLESACSLAKKLCAMGAFEKARSSLAVAQDALRMAQLRGLNYGPVVRTAEDTVLRKRKPRFVLNHARQIENAFRLGAIDEKRYRADMARVARQRCEIEADRPIRLACLGNAKFVTVLPIDEGLKPSDEVPTFVPYPGYCARTENLAPNQLAEYLNAFRDGDDLDLVAKYAWVRLSGLIRSAIHFVDRCDLASFLTEVEALAVMEPKCSRYAQPVKEILGYLAALSGSRRAAYATQLAKLLEPQTYTNGGITVSYFGPMQGWPGKGFFDSARELAREYGAT